tara:strand:- start:203 stop:454 length:252 start_codon:yes stop_codon:yes gene_type:complete
MYPHKDPISTIMGLFSLEDEKPDFLKDLNLYESVTDLMCPDKDKIQNNKDDILPRHFMICLYNFIAICIIKFLYFIGDKYGKI